MVEAVAARDAERASRAYTEPCRAANGREVTNKLGVKVNRVVFDHMVRNPEMALPAARPPPGSAFGCTRATK